MSTASSRANGAQLALFAGEAAIQFLDLLFQAFELALRIVAADGPQFGPLVGQLKIEFTDLAVDRRQLRVLRGQFVVTDCRAELGHRPLSLFHLAFESGHFYAKLLDVLPAGVVGEAIALELGNRRLTSPAAACSLRELLLGQRILFVACCQLAFGRSASLDQTLIGRMLHPLFVFEPLDFNRQSIRVQAFGHQRLQRFESSQGRRQLLLRILELLAEPIAIAQLAAGLARLSAGFLDAALGLFASDAKFFQPIKAGTAARRPKRCEPTAIDSSGWFAAGSYSAVRPVRWLRN